MPQEAMLTTQEKQLLEKARRYKELTSQWGMFLYQPYPKQIEFHHAGLQFRERLLLAGTQLGKTLAAAHEVAFHLTGLYPEWWDGKRFTKPTLWWIGSETAELTREGAQKKLMGSLEGERWVAGSIPGPLIADYKMSRGTPNAVEIVQVRHVTGGLSEGVFKAYADGREKWQAGTVHGIWPDEEPKAEIYDEALARTAASNGILLMTLTPLKGMSTVVKRFYPSPDTAYRHLTMMTIDDVKHFSEEDKKRAIAGYAPHEREARTKGIPMLGSGRVFPVPEEWLMEPDIPIPEHWPQIIGMDFGWDHPTAAVKLAWDREADCLHVTNTYRQSRETPLYHAAAIKPWGEFPVAWPHDALQHDKGSGEQLAAIYRRHGLKMVSEKAQFPDDRGYGVEAGIAEMLERMQTGRLKVFASCHDWFGEFRTYHRKDGKIVKDSEDILSAHRYGQMMLRYAKPRTAAEAKPDRYTRPYPNERTWMSM